VYADCLNACKVVFDSSTINQQAKLNFPRHPPSSVVEFHPSAKTKSHAPRPSLSSSNAKKLSSPHQFVINQLDVLVSMVIQLAPNKTTKQK
jgi:hypothetical protein